MYNLVKGNCSAWQAEKIIFDLCVCMVLWETCCVTYATCLHWQVGRLALLWWDSTFVLQNAAKVKHNLYLLLKKHDRFPSTPFLQKPLLSIKDCNSCVKRLKSAVDYWHCCVDALLLITEANITSLTQWQSLTCGLNPHWSVLMNRGGLRSLQADWGRAGIFVLLLRWQSVVSWLVIAFERIIYFSGGVSRRGMLHDQGFIDSLSSLCKLCLFILICTFSNLWLTFYYQAAEQPLLQPKFNFGIADVL